jgi:hypothetical protein
MGITRKMATSEDLRGHGAGNPSCDTTLVAALLRADGPDVALVKQLLKAKPRAATPGSVNTPNRL